MDNKISSCNFDFYDTRTIFIEESVWTIRSVHPTSIAMKLALFSSAVYSPSIDPSIQPSVHSCAPVCIHHASESITWYRQSAECHRRQPQKHSKSRKVIINGHDR